MVSDMLAVVVVVLAQTINKGMAKARMAAEMVLLRMVVLAVMPFRILALAVVEVLALVVSPISVVRAVAELS